MIALAFVIAFLALAAITVADFRRIAHLEAEEAEEEFEAFFE